MFRGVLFLKNYLAFLPVCNIEIIEPVQRPKKSRLAAVGRTDDAEYLILANFDIEVPEDLQ